MRRRLLDGANVATAAGDDVGPSRRTPTNDASWVGPGHGSVVPVGDRLYFTYHAWHANGAGQHDGARGRVILVDGWPRIHDGTPSEGLVPWPGA